MTHDLVLQVLADLVHLFGGQQDAAALLQRFDEPADARLSRPLQPLPLQALQHAHLRHGPLQR